MVISDELRQKLYSREISQSDFELFLQFYTKALVGRYDGLIDPQLNVTTWVVGNEVTACWLWCDNQIREVMSMVVNNGNLARMFITAKQINPNAELVFAEDHLLENQETDLRHKFIQVVDALIKQGAPIDSISFFSTVQM